MSLALKARQKARRKGGARDRVFGCDLLEHLQHSGQDVPQVLRSCTEFVEQHGVVDGIYRLSGVSSNIQRLRQEFDSDRCPDLRRDVYLQDIHCVSSLCKAYFRELPNPLLTYQLYDKFADAVATQMEEARLVKIKEVLKELPLPHYRTLEFLMRHLLLMASHSSQTNMHARNLAIVWAPNLLRSRDIEATGFNGTAAFMEVRVQSIVVEFILTHVEQLFGDAPLGGSDSPRRSRLLGGGVPGDGQSPPYHVPAVLSQGDGPPPIRPYHTIIELSDQRRKGSIKAKKWRSIFNLGRSSHEAKRRLAKAEEKDEKGGKTSLRPAKSMDSLSSLPFTSDDDPGLRKKRSARQPRQRRDSFDVGSSPPESGSELGEKPAGQEEPQGPELEGESSTKSEPTTPKAGRAALVAPGRSPKAACSRAEKCAGVHISGPFSVTVPLHITSNLSRLTRGLPCPALAQAPTSPPPPTRDTDRPERRERRPAQQAGAGNPGDTVGLSVPPCPLAGEGDADAEETRLSLELRDSFAFLDSQEPWLEGAGDGELVLPSLLPASSAGDGEGFLAMEEAMESGFMNPEEPPAEEPGSYLSIEECMDEEMFYMAPSGSDAEDPAGDTDSDDMFLSAHDDLSPLVSHRQPPGEDTATETPRTGPGRHCHPATGHVTSARAAGTGAGAGGAGSHAGAAPVPDAVLEEVEEDGAGSAPPATEPGSPLPPALEEPAVPQSDPGFLKAPTPRSSPGRSSLSTSALDLRGACVEPSRAKPPGPDPSCREPLAVLRRDGSAPVRLASRTVRVQQARSVPVVPPKPQFARVPPALQPWTPHAAEANANTTANAATNATATAANANDANANDANTANVANATAAATPHQLPTSPAPEGPPHGPASVGMRRAGWRERGCVSFDAAVAAAVEQQLSQAPRLRPSGEGDSAPTTTAKALPFQTSPLRPRLLRPRSCTEARGGEETGRIRLGLSRPAAQAEGAAGAGPAARASVEQ
ncbi:rho GTPase-activating protein 30 [Porphyrio hochstetteri]